MEILAVSQVLQKNSSKKGTVEKMSKSEPGLSWCPSKREWTKCIPEKCGLECRYPLKAVNTKR